MTQLILKSAKIVTDKKTLLQIAKTLKSVTNEASILLTSEGLIFKSLDKMHVYMIDMRLTGNIFEKFDIDKDITLGIKTPEFAKLVSSLDKKGSIIMEIINDKIFLAQNDFKCEFELIDEFNNDIPIPKLDYTVRAEFGINFKVDYLKNSLKKLRLMSEYVTISSNELKMTLSVDENKIMWNKDQINLKIKEDTETIYNIDLLLGFLKTLDKKSNLVLEYANRKPIRLTTDINNLGIIQFYLAPRVEN